MGLIANRREQNRIKAVLTIRKFCNDEELTCKCVEHRVSYKFKKLNRSFILAKIIPEEDDIRLLTHYGTSISIHQLNNEETEMLRRMVIREHVRVFSK